MAGYEPNKRKFDNIFKYLDEKKKEQGLIHIKTDRETPGLVFDIEEYGIYYDSTRVRRLLISVNEW